MKNKKLLSIILAGLMVGATMVAPTFVLAENTTDNAIIRVNENAVSTKNGVATLGSGTASIKIDGNVNQTLVGKKFGVYKLFNAENSLGGESINYTFNPTYEQALKEVIGKKLGIKPSEVTEYKAIDYIQSINQNKQENASDEQPLEGRYSDFRYFIEELRNKMSELNMQPQVVNVADVKIDNSIEIKGLEYGYYIIDEISNVAGTESAGGLCIVDTANPTSEITIKSDYPTIEKKIQEDDNRENVGVDGWNDIADFEIGQTVPYTYYSKVPNMNGYHNYYFAFHDKMDTALTFKKDTVSVVITDEDGTEYTLAPTEFKVVTENINDETFNIVIDDLKAIVDREFNNMNSNKENIYGQKIQVRFDAILNDNASLNTGRPGFENDVRLEFSNDPDNDNTNARNTKSTGFTPWDTVVAFTYKLDLTKTNNDNKVLANAHFRLYSDKECKNEVYVKQNEQGDYIVINRDSVIGDTVPTDAVEMVTPADGNLVIYGLDGQVYYLKETKAPEGYRLLLDPLKLTVSPKFTEERQSYIKGDGATEKTLIDLSVTAETNQFYDGKDHPETINLKTNIDDGVAFFNVVNHKGVQMPKSGSDKNLGLVFGGTALVLVAGSGYIVYRKVKKVKVENEE